VLHLHRAERADLLVDALGEVLRTPLADPFTPEVVAVPAKGVERWVSQRLSAVLGTSAGDGVSANLLFPSPARLVAQVVAAASGTEPDDDPWAPGRVLWRLLDVIDSCTGEAWCGVLAAHLGGADPGSHRRGRRWATAALLADLFTSYGAERPAMLVDWAAGRDTDGTGSALPDDLLWQPALWRRLGAALGAPSPAERLEQTCRRVQDEADVVDLPARLSLFGPTRLTTEQLTVLRALAVRRDVHVWVPHPSPAMWDRLSARPAGGKRRDDDSGLHVTHPLLASLARDTRELQQRLQPVVDADTHHPAAGVPTSLLGHLQRAVRDDVVPAQVAPADGSVQVHACHGPARQVEVLREALLHAFESDASLEPRDVLVMCPDVEAWAPLVKAAFGQGAAAGPDAHPGHRLRVRLADRSLRQTNPLLGTVAGLLDLAGGRVTASELLDLAATEPGAPPVRLLRRRPRAAAGVGGARRCALGHRQPAAQRLRPRGGPLGDVDDRPRPRAARGDGRRERADLARHRAAAGRRRQHRRRPGRPAGRAGRPAVVGAGPAAGSAAGGGVDHRAGARARPAHRRPRARRLAGRAGPAGAGGGHRAQCLSGGGADLLLADVRAMLAGRLAGRPTRANFRTGELTVCTMVPMRSVPHRVVALLGLDDDAFPRGAGVDGDDVLSRDPCVGERDRRSEDRQLLLDAVLSAGDRLLLLYTGADPVTGQERPPAVPLGELLDVVAQTAGVPPEALVRRHPLQPFDPRNVDAADPFSFDPHALRAAQASVGERVPPRPLLPAPLPPQAEADVSLADLVAFVQHPVQAFLRQRLGCACPTRTTTSPTRSRPSSAGWRSGTSASACSARG
jgi:exodeoxyribonuclease V gamma subunit